MTTAIKYPNGQTLVSSALSPADVAAALQIITCGMLGINPPNDKLVRIDWQTTGQPSVAAPNSDVCYLACQPFDTEYSRVRDRRLGGTDAATETWAYTKGWRVSWTAYGPSAEDHLRAVKSALFMDYFTDRLEAVKLFPLPDAPEVVRVPELVNAQWFERADFHCDMYEAVTETIQYSVVTSAEIKVYDGDIGQVADVTSTPVKEL